MTEAFPLEAMTCLSWTGGLSPDTGPHALINYVDRKLTLEGYRWNNVTVDTLRKMRKLLHDRGWVDRDPRETLARIEDHFSDCWVNNRYDTNNVQYILDHYVSTGKGIGGDRDKAVLISALLKSWGIATNFVRSTLYPKWNPTVSFDHVHNVCFDPESKLWMTSDRELTEYARYESEKEGNVFVFGVFRPPVMQSGYLSWKEWGPKDLAVNAWCRLAGFTPSRVHTEFSRGFPTSEMKTVILSEVGMPPPISFSKLLESTSGVSLEALKAISYGVLGGFTKDVIEKLYLGARKKGDVEFEHALKQLLDRYEMSFCPYCNRAIKRDASFCDRCGRALH